MQGHWRKEVKTSGDGKWLLYSSKTKGTAKAQIKNYKLNLNRTKEGQAMKPQGQQQRQEHTKIWQLN